MANNEYSVAGIKTGWGYDIIRKEPRFKELYLKLNFDAYDEYSKSLK